MFGEHCVYVLGERSGPLRLGRGHNTSCMGGTVGLLSHSCDEVMVDRENTSFPSFHSTVQIWFLLLIVPKRVLRTILPSISISSMLHM